jgi:hypothetical protein
VTECNSSIGSRDLFDLIAPLEAAFWRTMVHETGSEHALPGLTRHERERRAWAEV